MKKANPIKCVRAKTYWIGYLKNIAKNIAYTEVKQFAQKKRR